MEHYPANFTTVFCPHTAVEYLTPGWRTHRYIYISNMEQSTKTGSLSSKRYQLRRCHTFFETPTIVRVSTVSRKKGVFKAAARLRCPTGCAGVVWARCSDTPLLVIDSAATGEQSRPCAPSLESALQNILAGESSSAMF